MRTLALPAAAALALALAQPALAQELTGTLKKIKDFSVLLPPVEEQTHIAEILDTLDEAIRKTEAVVAKLRANSDPAKLYAILTEARAPQAA